MPTPVREAFNKFDKVAVKYAKYGTLDTEPETVMQSYIAFKLGLNGYTPYGVIPSGPEKWQIYSDMPGADVIAEHLTEALLVLEQELKAVYFDSVQEIRSYLWRAL